MEGESSSFEETDRGCDNYAQMLEQCPEEMMEKSWWSLINCWHFYGVSLYF